MNISNSDLLLYLVTDRSWSSGDQLFEHVEDALKNGVSFLQLREKGSDYDFFLKEAVKMKTLTNKYNVPFVINDNVDITLESGADGVHIGQGDASVLETRKRIGTDKILGVSVRTVKQALKAEKEGADYLGVGAMFTTSTKLDTKPVSKITLKEICSSVNIPVVAIGGVSSNNILELKGTSLNGVAVVSAILAEKNIKKATNKIRSLAEILTNTIIPKVLTIAGSDCSGGAGIQADLKTMVAHNCYGMSVITALTAQNTTGVYGIENCSALFVENQLECVFSDIFPDAVKIGMVSSSDIIKTITRKLKEHKPPFVVVDPVMVSTSGSKLLDDRAMDSLINDLLPLATVITPNLSEAEILSGLTIKTENDMISAAKKISESYSGHILVKGGHLVGSANDLLYSNGDITWFKGERVNNRNTHGTGCTLSSAIASNLAIGFDITESIANSKKYITGALKHNLNLGKGCGPINHNY